MCVNNEVVVYLERHFSLLDDTASFVILNGIYDIILNGNSILNSNSYLVILDSNT